MILVAQTGEGSDTVERVQGRGLHVCYGYPTQFLGCLEERLKQQEHGLVKDYQA